MQEVGSIVAGDGDEAAGGEEGMADGRRGWGRFGDEWRGSTV